MSVLVNEKLEALKSKAKKIRRHIVRMIGKAGSGHPGGSLSSVEIMTALYFYKMKINALEPKWKYRDFFLMSKGHAAPVWYATLAEAGFFPKDELDTLRKLGSKLQGHPDMKRCPGVEMSSGSLGQGLSVANGIALGGKIDEKVYRVYVLLGDGELQEGQIWEAAMAAAHFKLDNLCAFVDFNGLQIDGPIEEIMSPLPLEEKWTSFGWNAITVDGHNFTEITNAMNQAEMVKGKPTVVICRTVKGKGVSFMENNAGWHGKAPNKEEVEKALAELEEQE